MPIEFVQKKDAGEIAELYGYYVANTAISFEAEQLTSAEMEGRILSVLTWAPWLVCKVDGEVLGYAYASKHKERDAYKWSVDTAVYVRNDCRKRGIGSNLYRTLIALLKLQHFYAAHAGITLPNEGSVELHKRMGFQFIGTYPKVGYKLGKWHDVAWWQLQLQNRDDAPQSLRSLAEVQNDPQCYAILADQNTSNRISLAT